MDALLVDINNYEEAMPWGEKPNKMSAKIVSTFSLVRFADMT